MASGLYSQHVNNKKMLYLRNTIIILMLVTLAVCCLFPLFYMIVNSFGPAVEAASSNRSVFPTSWSLDSYKAFFSFSEYSVKWLANTFVVSACQVLGNVVFASLAGYAFAKLKFKGKNFLFNLILIGMMIPYQVTQVPLYILIVNKFHLSNSYAALVLPGLVTSYNIFLTKQFFSSIPTSLLESAKLDGCSQPKIFTHIVLPLSKTILAVMVLLYAIGHWNSYFNAMLYISDKQKWPLQIFLREILIANQIDMTSMTGSSVQEMMRRQELQTLLKYALIVVASVPVLVVYPFVQKHLVKGVMIGSVKG